MTADRSADPDLIIYISGSLLPEDADIILGSLKWCAGLERDGSLLDPHPA